MLSVLGRGIRSCDGITRREILSGGALSMFGLTWADKLRANAKSTTLSGSEGARGFGKAKACIVVFNYGGPSHLETFDPKPNAPTEIRGEFRPISTSVPGLSICEHLPRLSRSIRHCSVVRSMTHRDNDHAIGAYLALTGRSHPRNDVLGIEFPMSPTDMPSMGSALSKIRPAERPVFSYVTLGDLRHFGHNDSLGQGAGCLGRIYDPFTLPFVRPMDGSIDLSSIRSVTQPVEALRLDGRRDLLSQMAGVSRVSEVAAATANLDRFRRRAFELLASNAVRDAFEVSREPAAVQERYGPSNFGHNCLLARRLVEAGVPMVTVYSFGNRDWDTHGDNFKQMKNTLLPPTDHGLSALLEDLDDRGMLDETLVIWMGDMGRTPRVNGSAGRDHWSFCYSLLMAGAGIKAGQVVGSSDRSAAYPAESPISPSDIAATVFHCLGIEPNTHVEDQLGRPFVLCPGSPVQALLA